MAPQPSQAVRPSALKRAPANVGAEETALPVNPGYRFIRASPRLGHILADCGYIQNPATHRQYPAVAPFGAGMKDGDAGKRGGFIQPEDLVTFFVTAGVSLRRH